MNILKCKIHALSANVYSAIKQQLGSWGHHRGAKINVRHHKVNLRGHKMDNMTGKQKKTFILLKIQFLFSDIPLIFALFSCENNCTLSFF